jgi:hypothetical protein
MYRAPVRHTWLLVACLAGCGKPTQHHQDGPVLLFTARDTEKHHGLFQVSLDGTVSSVDVPGPFNFVVSPGGTMLAGTGRSRTLRVGDREYPIDDAHAGLLRGVSDDGTRVVIEMRRPAKVGGGYDKDIVVITLGGAQPVMRTIVGGNLGYDVRLSADGARLAYSSHDAACKTPVCDGQLWIVELPDGAPRTLVSSRTDMDYTPRFEDPHGDALTFVSIVDGKHRVQRVRTGGSNAAELVLDDAVALDGVFFARRGTAARTLTVFRSSAPPIMLRDNVTTFMAHRDGRQVAIALADSPGTIAILDRDGRDVVRVVGGDQETYLIGWMRKALPTGSRRLAPVRAGTAH